MCGPSIESLTFWPSSHNPTSDMRGKAALLLSACHGYHLVERLEFDVSGGFLGFFVGDSGPMVPHVSFIAWALLPCSITLSKKFPDE